MKKAIRRALCLLLVLSLCGSMFISAAASDVAVGKMRCVGDVNDDGNPNAVDARWILQASSGLRTIAESDMLFADINEDGKINAVDARWILQMASGTRAQKWYVFSEDGA
ncbi:MAG: dockerin type I repeat-containing protein, partial [Candidatus Fimenecus sp.]